MVFGFKSNSINTDIDVPEFANKNQDKAINFDSLEYDDETLVLVVQNVNQLKQIPGYLALKVNMYVRLGERQRMKVTTDGVITSNDTASW